MTEILRPLWIPYVFLATCALSGCQERREEPTPAAAAPAATGLAPVRFRPPAGWATRATSPTGTKRAIYTVAKTGADTEDAEVQVLFFGTGSAADRDKQWKEWSDPFDGDPLPTAKREELTSPAGKVELFEVSGDFAIDMGPKVRGRAAAQQIKKGFTLLGAVVHGGERGPWYVRMLGPSATVDAARADFVAMLTTAE